MYTGPTPLMSSGPTPLMSSGSTPLMSSGSTPLMSSGSTPLMSSGPTLPDSLISIQSINEDRDALPKSSSQNVTSTVQNVTSRQPGSEACMVVSHQNRILCFFKKLEQIYKSIKTKGGRISSKTYVTRKNSIRKNVRKTISGGKKSSANKEPKIRFYNGSILKCFLDGDDFVLTLVYSGTIIKPKRDKSYYLTK
jgi:hypothetical protein